MSIRFKLLFYLLFMFLSVSNNLHAQNDILTVILSAKVGSSINLNERNKYSLFPQYENFDSATVHKVDNGSYFIRFFLHDEHGTSIDSNVWYSEKLITTISEKIDHYDQLKDGSYKIGDSDAKMIYIKTDNRISVPAVESPFEKQVQNQNQNDQIDKAWSDELPFPKYVGEKETTRWHLAFGVNVSSISYDFSGVNRAFSAIEDKYRSQGYTITPHNQSFKISPWIGATLQIRVYNDLHFIVETGNPMSSGDWAYGSEKFYMVTGSLLYHYYPSDKKWMRTYLSFGVGKYYYEINRRYGINNRISETSQDGSFYYLENLSSSGGSTGYPLSCGIEFIGESGLSCSIFTNYTYAPPIEIQLVNGGKSTVCLGGVRVGGRVSLYF
ncbi:MAG: hypothetical protein HZB59_12955 [Ignavibacteriales bacterium]|nr:hypothetical protein [Ignavibacteriales bacterium]